MDKSPVRGWRVCRQGFDEDQLLRDIKRQSSAPLGLFRRAAPWVVWLALRHVVTSPWGQIKATLQHWHLKLVFCLLFSFFFFLSCFLFFFLSPFSASAYHPALWPSLDLSKVQCAPIGLSNAQCVGRCSNNRKISRELKPVLLLPRVLGGCFAGGFSERRFMMSFIKDSTSGANRGTLNRTWFASSNS